MTRAARSSTRPAGIAGAFHRATGVAASVLLVALAGCSALPTRDLALSHQEARAFARHDVAPPSTVGFAPANATAVQRRETLDRIWKVVEDVYFDPTFATVDLPGLEARSRADLQTVRSDADFYRVLQARVGELPDSHSGVLTPQQAEDEHTQRTTLMGLAYAIVDGHVVIVRVQPGFPADEAGVKPGMLVDAVDDHPVDAAFLEAAAAKSSLADGTDPRAAQLEAVSDLMATGDDGPIEHRVTLRRADDSLWTVTLRPRDGDLPTDEHLTMRASGVAVLRLSRFDPSALPALARDVDAARASSRALIVDLRDNPGGEIDTAEQLIDRFIDHKVVFGSLIWRVWRFPVTFNLFGDPVATPYMKPLAVLIDGSSASAAELAAHALVELRHAIAVGEPSCGCVVGLAEEFLLPDGGVLRVAEAGFRSAHERRMERDPLVPTIAVSPTLAQLRAGDDVALEAAEKALLAQVPSAPAE